jgi:hypothetical protein
MYNDFENHIIIIMCTLDDGGVINSKRTNIAHRILDTKSALIKWLSLSKYQKFIIIENSGYKSTIFTELISIYTNKQIEFLQFNGQNFDRNLGKGYGVLNALKYLEHNSLLFNENEHFVIIPGRYYIKNHEKILNIKSDIISDFQNKLSYAFNPLFKCTRNFIINYLVPYLEQTNDSIGVHFEHCLAKAVHSAIASGVNWDLPCEAPIVDGISGTSNLRYYKNNLHKFFIITYSRFKYFFFSFAR